VFIYISEKDSSKCKIDENSILVLFVFVSKYVY